MTKAYVFDAYGTLFDVHSVSATLGYDQTQFDWDEIRADRTVFYSNQLQEINAGDASVASAVTIHGHGRIA